MKSKFLSAILILILSFGGISMLTSCQDKTQTFTLNLLTTPIYADDDTSVYPYEISWGSHLFECAPSVFSPHLAKTALLLSSSAYKHKSIIDNLQTLGFSQIQTFNYDKSYNEKAVGTAIASTRLENTTVISITLRGTFLKEWYSNFDIGEDVTHTGVHHGFNHASDLVLNKLDAYINENNIDTTNLKFLVTGHSRGAAVANLVSKALIDTYGSKNVYAYTFATPNTTTNVDANDNKYSGIYNFVNPEDFIAFIPLYSWNFTKYGTTITFPQKDNDANYEEKLTRVAQKYENIRGRKFKTYNGTESLNKFIKSAEDLAPTVKDYYDTQYEILGDKMSLYDYMNMIAQILNEENLVSNGLILLSSDESPFKEIKNFILHGMDTHTSAAALDYESSLISYAHTAETYLAWLKVYIEDMGL